MDNLRYVKTQTISTLIGLTVMLFLVFFDYQILGKLYIPIYIISLLLLVAVLVFGTGDADWGSKSWLYIGKFGFQPAEFVKLGLIISLAWYLDIHKDDLKFKMAEHPIKKFGSQGQQKSFLIALKVAQLEIIKKQLKVTPILLLDDIFDKLDESRVEQLIKLVNEEHFGQIFLSDTHPQRTHQILGEINDSHRIFEL